VTQAIPLRVGLFGVYFEVKYKALVSSTVPAQGCGYHVGRPVWGRETVAHVTSVVNILPQSPNRPTLNGRADRENASLRVFSVAAPHQLSTRSVASSLGISALHYSITTDGRPPAQRFVFYFAEMPTPSRCPFSRSSRELMPSVRVLSNTATTSVTNSCVRSCHNGSIKQ